MESDAGIVAHKCCGVYDVSNCYKEVINNLTLFDKNTWRQDAEGSPHKDTKTVFLRGPHLLIGEKLTPDIVFNRIEAITEEDMYYLHECKRLLHDVIYATKAFEIGRAMVVMLKPGGFIPPHKDEGEYASYYDRYHCVIHGRSIMTFPEGVQEVIMKEGELWWVNTSERVHSVINLTNELRVHLIVDVRCD